ncbi:MAG: hypothetical protein EOP64_04325, partial [Sphingomonas sp.]
LDAGPAAARQGFMAASAGPDGPPRRRNSAQGLQGMTALCEVMPCRPWAEFLRRGGPSGPAEAAMKPCRAAAGPASRMPIAAAPAIAAPVVTIALRVTLLIVSLL